MVTLTALWLPILVAAVLVFVASSVIHMALPWHSKDFKRFADADSVLDALRAFDLAPGDYAAPIAESMKEMGSPEFKAKVERGPRIMLTVLGPDNSMGRNLVFWFVYLIVVSVFAAWRLEQGEWALAAASFAEAVRMARRAAFIEMDDGIRAGMCRFRSGYALTPAAQRPYPTHTPITPGTEFGN